MGLAHATLLVAAGGMITDLTALVAISASALVGAQRPDPDRCSYLGDVVTSLSRPKATEELALCQ